jgi:ADP-heptose:LPS heptosyltransferase
MGILTRQIHESLMASGAMRRPAVEPSAPPVAQAPPEEAVVLDDCPAAIVRCHGAAGDVLLAAAIAGALVDARPGKQIVVETAHAYLCFRNPWIDAVVRPGHASRDIDEVIDLRPEADWMPKEHRLKRFAELAGVEVERAKFFIHCEPLAKTADLRAHGLTDAEGTSRDGLGRPSYLKASLPDDYIVMHVGPTGDPTWKGRNWLVDRWLSVAERLVREGRSVVLVGSRASPLALPEGVLDLRAKTTAHEMAHVVDRASLFVGIESFPGNVAQCLGVPAVLFFGSILPELRIFRDNVLPVSARHLRCLGCHHDEPRPNVTYTCRVGGEPCQERVTVEMLLAAVRSWLGKGRAKSIVIPPRPKAAHEIVVRPCRPMRQRTTVVLRRQSTLGDVLVASGVAAAVKRRQPQARIVFHTACPAPLRRHPLIDQVVCGPLTAPLDLLYDMDAACERFPYANMLEAYAASAAVRAEDCEFHFHCEPLDGLPSSYAVMHAGPAGSAARRWVGRDWFQDRFSEIARRLSKRGLQVVLVGDGRPTGDTTPWPANTLDFRGRTTMYQLGTALRHARLFVGIDSFPLHVAQALNVPGVCFFGSVRPELRLFRANMTGVSADFLPCIGCHHDRRPLLGDTPETSICRIGHEHCRTAVTVERFWEAVEERI